MKERETKMTKHEGEFEPIDLLNVRDLGRELIETAVYTDLPW